MAVLVITNMILKNNSNQYLALDMSILITSSTL